MNFLLLTLCIPILLSLTCIHAFAENFDFQAGKIDPINNDLSISKTDDNFKLISEKSIADLDRNFCSFKTIDRGSGLSIIDSIILRTALNGSDVWGSLDELNNADCKTILTNDKLIMIKEVPGVAKLEYFYQFKNNSAWKTKMIITNLSNEKNLKFAPTETINFKNENVTIGSLFFDVGDNNGELFDHDWLAKNNSTVIKLKNGASLDYLDAFDRLWALRIIDRGLLGSSVSFDYAKNAQVLQPGESLEIDPTFNFGSTSGSELCDLTSSPYSLYCGQKITDTTVRNKVVTSATFYVKKVGSPTGQIYARLLKVSDNSVIATSTDSYDTSTMSTSLTAVTWHFGTDAITPNENFFIGTYFSYGGSSSNQIAQYGAADNVSDQIWRYNMGGSWGEDASYDVRGSMTYTELIKPPQPTSFTADSQARKVQFTWTTSNGTGTNTYYIGRSLNNVTFPSANKTNVGNVTTYLSTAYWAINKLYYVNVTAAGGLNSTSKYASFTTDTYPSAPLNPYTTGRSETSIKLNWSPPTSNGNDPISGYRIEYCITCTSWSLVVNKTNTYNYNQTGIPGGSTVKYRMATWNGVGLSSYTANFTGKIWTPTSGSLSLNVGKVGDVMQVNSTISITDASPSPVTVSLLRMYVNGTLYQTHSESTQIPSGGSSSNFSPFWYQMNTGGVYQVQLRATISNSTGNVVFNATSNQSRQYQPDYFTAVVPSLGLVNYTETRTSNGEILNLKVNRDKNSATFQVECNFRDTWAAIKNQPGTWYNRTGVGYYNATLPFDAGSTVYFDCYNDDLLFTGSSYGNNTANPLVVGVQLFDQFGGLMGAQAVVIVIIGIFAMANGKNSPQILVLGMIVCGVLAGLDLLVFDQTMWGMLMAASAVGLFAMRRYYF